MNIIWWSENMIDNFMSYVMAPVLVISFVYCIYFWLNIITNKIRGIKRANNGTK